MNKRDEKELLKKFLFSSIFLSLSLIAACGGGSSGTTPQTEPSQNLQGTYTGAATAGDFAIFTVSGTTLSYSLKGAIFGQIKDSIDIEPMFAEAGPYTHFWKSTSGNVAIFLSGNIGLAYVQNAKDTQDAIVVGLKDVSNINNIIGKTFVYVDLRTNGVDGCEIKINGTINDTSGTFDYTCLSGHSGTGCWKLNSQSNILTATVNPPKDANGNPDCVNWDGSNPTEYVIAKPGNNRAGFVVDHTDGSGVGIGLERKAYSTELNRDKVYTFETLSIDSSGKICPAIVTISFDGVDWKYEWKSTYCNETARGTLSLDNVCPNTTYNGVICATDNKGNQYNVMFDPVDGYYIAISTDGTYIEIGALK